MVISVAMVSPVMESTALTSTNVHEIFTTAHVTIDSLAMVSYVKLKTNVPARTTTVPSLHHAATVMKTLIALARMALSEMA